MNLKKCTKCNTNKPLSEFPKNRNQCTSCCSTATAVRMQRMRERKALAGVFRREYWGTQKQHDKAAEVFNDD